MKAYSKDQNWMPSLVLIAKNTYVWLDQLSKKYQTEIRHLDQIPNKELDILASRGINGLWLIGLWERSPASKFIKQKMGNKDAVASAYSLYDYKISEDLGGERAADRLRKMAKKKGIRIASDMVPNHMGIDSRWLEEHPDWFISLKESPYPNYRFTDENLTNSKKISVFLEDSYYQKTDASVVFKHIDKLSGKSRYIYHGNDGTNMPWNDTAQLNYLIPEVREAVIQTIIKVAQQFQIIRFDAAMALAKEHIQRLWFPEPGTGEVIPSRSRHGISKNEFDSRIPKEFWREVVDRISIEAPNTLLLAEAFWMMEGYFVRDLGMHRVYNSAFMQMLRDEKNKEYRQVITNTLEYDPQILKRFVNYMNNPDEKTAKEQFGSGDKYFGICTMMATLPGLPMFGHGQIEGFSEKYGMEYKAAKLDEKADQDFVTRHQNQIFPLLKKRKLFSDVENFIHYDLVSSSGVIQENVFAYSNRFKNEKSLVIFHNKFVETQGWIKTSSISNKVGLGDGLDLPTDPDAFVIFQDLITKKEYIRNCLEIHEKGLFIDLRAYQTFVFINFKIVMDGQERKYSKLVEKINRKPVSSIARSLLSMSYEGKIASIYGLQDSAKTLLKNDSRMKILFLASEALPFIKVGGLGDVAGSLPFAIHALDSHPDIRMVIPLHRQIDLIDLKLKKITKFSIDHIDGVKKFEIYQATEFPIPIYFIGGDVFEKALSVYLEDGHQDSIRYTFFSLAALKLVKFLDWRPQIVHANDWHTATAISVINNMKTENSFFKETKTLLTVHNLPYLGNQAGDILEGFKIFPSVDNSLPDWAQSMPLALGLYSADHVSTVSEGYAKEIQTEEYGSGLHEYIKSKKAKLTGILNGLDLDSWDPATDQKIEFNFDVKNLGQRANNKTHLLKELNLEFNKKTPLLSIISRMDYQKGIDTAIQAIQNLENQNWQCVILGSGDPEIETQSKELESLYPDKVRVLIKYDEGLARKIYASADMILIPSRYEPCGLTQMIGMRYGSVPIARTTGGLRDTIKDYSSVKRSTGFLYEEVSSEALGKTLEIAFNTFNDQRKWRGLQRRGMKQDFSWDRSAKKYMSLYNKLIK